MFLEKNFRNEYFFSFLLGLRCIIPSIWITVEWGVNGIIPIISFVVYEADVYGAKP